MYSRPSLQNIYDWKLQTKEKIHCLIYLYEKDSYEAKQQFLINKNEKVNLKQYNDPKASIEYSNNMQDVYEHK